MQRQPDPHGAGRHLPDPRPRDGQTTLRPAPTPRPRGQRPRLHLPQLQPAPVLDRSTSHNTVVEGRTHQPGQRVPTVRVSSPAHPPRRMARNHGHGRPPRHHPPTQNRPTPATPPPQPLQTHTHLHTATHLRRGRRQVALRWARLAVVQDLRCAAGGREVERGRRRVATGDGG